VKSLTRWGAMACGTPRFLTHTFPIFTYIRAHEKQCMAKSKSNSPHCFGLKSSLSLPRFFPRRRMKELRGMVSGSRPFILKQRSSIILRMISDQASFPLAQSICRHLPINNLIHSFFHDLATNHL